MAVLIFSVLLSSPSSCHPPIMYQTRLLYSSYKYMYCYDIMSYVPHAHTPIHTQAHTCEHTHLLKVAQDWKEMAEKRIIADVFRSKKGKASKCHLCVVNISKIRFWMHLILTADGRKMQMNGKSILVLFVKSWWYLCRLDIASHPVHVGTDFSSLQA